MLKNSRINHLLGIYLVPGLVFQSVIVGGGYGTGREITEFFLVHGAVGGLIGMLISCLVWGLVLAIAFEFARITKSYNYKTFFQALLGPFWWLFEVIYVLIAFLVLAVLGSAAGEIVSQEFGIKPFYGVVVLMLLVGLLTFLGSKSIERFFVFWSGVLFLTYFLVLLITFSNSHDQISSLFTFEQLSGSWAVDGVRYAAYNLNALAAVLFVVPRFMNTKHTVGAGLIAGVIAIAPGILVFITLLAGYPQVIQSPIPIVDILMTQNLLWLLILFKVMLFGTFIETGGGVIHAINERIANTFALKHKEFPNWVRAAIALTFLVAAIFLANAIGIIQLISKGYGLLSYAYIVVVIVPLLIFGTFRILKTRSRER